MLDADVHALLQLPVADDLGHLHADRARVHVEDHAGAAVVELVRHALLLRRIHLDVDVVTWRSVIEKGSNGSSGAARESEFRGRNFRPSVTTSDVRYVQSFVRCLNQFSPP